MSQPTISAQPDRSRIKAYRLFFAAAMVQAALMLPLALWAMATGSPAALASGPAHGSEMLAGYALAVMAGFLLPPLTRPQAMLLLGCWLLGRVASVAAITLPWLIIADPIFAISMVILIVPRFIGAAKKWRNQATAPLVALIAATASTAIVLVAAGASGSARPVLYAGVTALAALLLFMGGRVTAPAVIGALNRRGVAVAARLQPRMEGAMLLCFIPAVATQAYPPLQLVAGLATAAAGGLGLIRLLRWRVWRCGWCPGLWGLGLGYAWVCAGLLLLAAAWLGADLPPILGLHVITVGGLGTLSLNVMGRTWLLRVRRNPVGSVMLAAGSALIGLATGLRVAAIALAMFVLNLWAAAAWSAAFAVILMGLLRVEYYRRST